MNCRRLDLTLYSPRTLSTFIEINPLGTLDTPDTCLAMFPAFTESQ